MSTEVYPVVHINDPYQAVEQVGIARDSGADGAYLIDHISSTTEVLSYTYKKAAAKYPEFFIGVNALCLPGSHAAYTYLKLAMDSHEITRLPDGLWVDSADRALSSTDILRGSDTRLRSIRYLGGIAFKGTVLYTDDPEKAAVEAQRLEKHVDVVTTSGSNTGSPPPLEKIAAMKAAITKPLAVASGISVDNLEDYGDNIDQLLVASSVETSPGSGIFDQSKLQDLINLAHEL